MRFNSNSKIKKCGTSKYLYVVYVAASIPMAAEFHSNETLPGALNELKHKFINAILAIWLAFR